MAEETRGKDRMPWAFAVGVGIGALGLFALVAGDGALGAWVALGIGVLLICTGLIQRSIERRR